MCVATFLVRSIKALIRHEARHYGILSLIDLKLIFIVAGVDVSRYNYMLLFLAAVQFGSVYFMGA